jgi:hypothetical protein
VVPVLAVEIETAAPKNATLAAGSPQEIEYRTSFVDGAGSGIAAEDVVARRAAARRPLIASPDEMAAAIRLPPSRARR